MIYLGKKFKTNKLADNQTVWIKDMKFRVTKGHKGFYINGMVGIGHGESVNRLNSMLSKTTCHNLRCLAEMCGGYTHFGVSPEFATLENLSTFVKELTRRI